MPDLIEEAEAAVAEKDRAFRQANADDHETYSRILLRHRHPMPGDAAKLARLMDLLDRTADDVRGDVDAIEKLDAVQEEVDAIAAQLDELDPAEELDERRRNLDRELAIQIDALLESKRRLLATIKRRRDLDEQMSVAVRRKQSAAHQLRQRMR